MASGWAQNISSSASDENLNTLPGDLPRPLKFGLCSSIFYGIEYLDGCWTTTDVELFAVCLDVLYRGVLNQHLFIVEGRRNRNFVDDAALLRCSLKECMSCRIDLNGSTEKFNGSYCQDMNWQAWHHCHYRAIANDMFGYYYAKLREWVPWIVFVWFFIEISMRKSNGRVRIWIFSISLYFGIYYDRLLFDTNHVPLVGFVWPIQICHESEKISF